MSEQNIYPGPMTFEQMTEIDDLLRIEETAFLITGLVWSDLPRADRIDLVADSDLPIAIAMHDDVFDVLPQHSRLWLQSLQRLVNSGLSWRGSGSIGRMARNLLGQGYLLYANDPVFDYFGRKLPTRDDIAPGLFGSPLYVKTIMGQRYLDWISQGST